MSDAMHRLAAFQRALAALLYEPHARAEFQKDPAAWLAPRGLAPSHAAMLRSIDPARLDYFHALQARDRSYFVRSFFPLTLAYVGDEALERYYETHPYGEDDLAAEAARFASWVGKAWPRGIIQDRAVRDLAAYESARNELQARPPAPQPGPRLPADDEPYVLSPHVRVVVFGADLPGMVDALEAGNEARVRPRRGWAVLRRGDDGEVRSAELDRETGWLLESFRQPTPPADVLEDEEDRARFRELCAAGVVVRAPPRV